MSNFILSALILFFSSADSQYLVSPNIQGVLDTCSFSPQIEFGSLLSDCDDAESSEICKYRCNVLFLPFYYFGLPNNHTSYSVCINGIWVHPPICEMAISPMVAGIASMCVMFIFLYFYGTIKYI
ncbi:hypothetical protein MHBO_001112 [Bonamia ostreae]|uniref:Uncharacterized protein n=1 Tax=Bonamia ostreae TaxID=126728 RepID=A0ABV2AIQ0_9EUKA